MKQQVIWSFCLSLLILTAPIASVATPLYYYSAHGSVVNSIDNSETGLIISGYMVIDSQLRDYRTLQPVTLPVNEGQFCYLIPEFSLKIHGVSFSGRVSTWETPYGPSHLFLEPMAGYDDPSPMWGLRGIGDWSVWDGFAFFFYNEDKTPYPYTMTTYSQLAPAIWLVGYPFFGDPYIPDYGIVDIWLTRVPVPEPSTVFLLVSGLTGFFVFQKKLRRW